MRVYWASKLHHADRLEREQQQSYFQGMEFTSSWTGIVHEVEDTPANAKTFWNRNLRDVMECEFCVVFAEKDDHLRGALFEAGFAMANGKPVIVVGEHPDYSTWQYLGYVYQATDFRHAAWMIKHMARGR